MWTIPLNEINKKKWKSNSSTQFLISLDQILKFKHTVMDHNIQVKFDIDGYDIYHSRVMPLTYLKQIILEIIFVSS